MQLKILTEASGSLTAGYLIHAIKNAGHFCVASDIDDSCFGRFVADDFIHMPQANTDHLWNIIEAEILSKKIDIVIPSLDETLLGWAERKQLFKDLGVHVIISESTTIAVCQDKWLTYQFFKEQGVPTPNTSLEQNYPLIKPRLGRGSTGIKITKTHVNMQGKISQQIIKGVEYTVDVFCDQNCDPVYIVPRRRISVKDGKSTAGIVEKNDIISYWIKHICQKLNFIGPINFQCFMLPDQSIYFLEINSRIAGGMALGFAATENWVDLIINNIIFGIPIKPKTIKYGLKMKRYYAEVFVP